MSSLCRITKKCSVEDKAFYRGLGAKKGRVPTPVQKGKK